MGIQLKNIYITLLYDAEQFYVKKKQDGGWIKICEIFSGKSLKEDLSIDTTFEPCYFSWGSTFKVHAAFGGKTSHWLPDVHIPYRGGIQYPTRFQ